MGENHFGGWAPTTARSAWTAKHKGEIMTTHITEWWCPKCKVILSPHEVTYEETHDTREAGCGHDVSINYLDIAQRLENVIQIFKIRLKDHQRRLRHKADPVTNAINQTAVSDYILVIDDLDMVLKED